MTALTGPQRAHRIGTTARIHAANPWTIFYTPWLILGGVFLLNYVIWQAVTVGAQGKPLPDDAFANNGGVSWVFVYMLVVAVQAMNQTFSFVVGLGATRRDYFLGTSLIFGLLSVMYGTGIALLAWVERATGGWGLKGYFFAPGPFRTVPIWQLLIVYVLVLAFMIFVGSAAAAMFVRWAANGLIAFFAVLAIIIVGAVYVITVNAWWSRVGDFVGSHTALQLTLLTLPLTAVAATAAFLLMRRATPKG